MEIQVSDKQQSEFELAIQNASHNIAGLYHRTKKIREYYASDVPNWTKVRAALNFGAGLTGAPKPNDEEYLVLKKFLASEFKDFSGDEIMLAFMKTASGQLKNPTEHYGKFSGAYIGKVLNEYKMLRHQKLAEEQRSEKANRPQKEVTDEEKRVIRRNYIKQCFLKPYNDLKTVGKNSFDIQCSVEFFMILYKGLVIMPSEEEVKDCRNRALNWIESHDVGNESDMKKARILKQKIADLRNGESNDMEQRLKNVSAYLFFINYVRELIAKNTDIEQFLETNKFYEI